MDGFNEGATALPANVHCKVPTARVAVGEPAWRGAKTTVKDVVSPGRSVTGRVGNPVTVKPEPDTAMDEMVCEAKFVAGFETVKM